MSHLSLSSTTFFFRLLFYRFEIQLRLMVNNLRLFVENLFNIQMNLSLSSYILFCMQKSVRDRTHNLDQFIIDVCL